MNYPENFTRGDIDTDTFRRAYDMALAKKSRIGILQLMKHSKIPQERAEEYVDRVIAEAKKQRVRQNRPHMIIGWLSIILGVGATIATFREGWIAYATIIMILWGIYWIVAHRD